MNYGPQQPPARGQFGLAAASVTAAVVAILLSLAAVRQLTGLGFPGGSDESAAGDPSQSTTTPTPEPLVVTDVGTDRPISSLNSPVENAVVDDEDLVIRGAAHYAGGVSHVEVLVQNLDTVRYWSPGVGLSSEAARFLVEVSEIERGDARDCWFEVRVPVDQLEPGPYSIRVWASSIDGIGQLEPFNRQVTVP